MELVSVLTILAIGGYSVTLSALAHSEEHHHWSLVHIGSRACEECRVAVFEYNATLEMNTRWALAWTSRSTLLYCSYTIVLSTIFRQSACLYSVHRNAISFNTHLMFTWYHSHDLWYQAFPVFLYFVVNTDQRECWGRSLCLVMCWQINKCPPPLFHCKTFFVSVIPSRISSWLLIQSLWLVALFPGPGPTFVTCNIVSNINWGGAWEQGYVYTVFVVSPCH